MKVESIKTRVVLPPKDDLEELLESYLPKLTEGSIVVISSKVVAICEGACITKDSISKEELVLQESDQVLISYKGKQKRMLTLRKGLIIGSAGVDESNADGYYVVLPRQPYASARRIWTFIRKSQNLQRLGVVIADSGTVPMHRGTVGIALSAYGFMPVKSYIGKQDIFGRRIEASVTNLMDGLAASAVLVMGEGDETTPLAIVTGLGGVEFYQRDIPLSKARRLGYVPPEIDVYTPLLHNRLWHRVRH